MTKRMHILPILIFICAFSSLYAQTGRITGTVKLKDGTPLPGVSISIAYTLNRTGTDVDGVYIISNIRQGMVTLIASMDGFQEQQRTVLVQADKTVAVDFTLELAPVSYETTVTAERPLLTTADKVSEVTLTPNQIETLPSLGEKDIFRAFQLLPGISGSQESSSGLYIRGEHRIRI